MAKKKTSKASEKTAKTLREALGIDKIFFNERINFVIGFCLLIIAGYLIWAFISYFATGSADQSLIESPREGEIMNEAREFQNSCGSLGAYASHFFIKRCFGLSAFFIPIQVLSFYLSITFNPIPIHPIGGSYDFPPLISFIAHPSLLLPRESN